MTEKKETREDIDKKESNQEVSEEVEEEKDSKEDIEKLEEEINTLQSDYDQLKDTLLRLQADFDNYKNRVSKEKKDIINYASEDLMIKLLPVLDNFLRALDNIDDKGIYEGVNLIYTQIFDVLKSEGLEEIDAEGQEFDPNYHHAVIMEDSDKYESGCVLEVLETGYTLNGKVIRPSMVKVVN